jgi:hypothetical protein
LDFGGHRLLEDVDGMISDEKEDREEDYDSEDEESDDEDRRMLATQAKAKAAIQDLFSILD